MRILELFLNAAISLVFFFFNLHTVCFVVGVAGTSHISFLLAETNVMQMDFDGIDSDETAELSELDAQAKAGEPTDGQIASTPSCCRIPLACLGFKSTRRLLNAISSTITLPPTDSFNLLKDHEMDKMKIIWRILRGNPNGIAKFRKLVYEFHPNVDFRASASLQNALHLTVTPEAFASLKMLARKVCVISS